MKYFCDTERSGIKDTAIIHRLNENIDAALKLELTATHSVGDIRMRLAETIAALQMLGLKHGELLSRFKERYPAIEFPALHKELFSQEGVEAQWDLKFNRRPRIWESSKCFADPTRILLFLSPGRLFWQGGTLRIDVLTTYAYILNDLQIMVHLNCLKLYLTAITVRTPCNNCLFRYILNWAACRAVRLSFSSSSIRVTLAVVKDHLQIDYLQLFFHRPIYKYWFWRWCCWSLLLFDMYIWGSSGYQF